MPDEQPAKRQRQTNLLGQFGVVPRFGSAQAGAGAGAGAGVGAEARAGTGAGSGSVRASRPGAGAAGAGVGAGAGATPVPDHPEVAEEAEGGNPWTDQYAWLEVSGEKCFSQGRTEAKKVSEQKRHMRCRCKMCPGFTWNYRKLDKATIQQHERSSEHRIKVAANNTQITGAASIRGQLSLDILQLRNCALAAYHSAYEENSILSYKNTYLLLAKSFKIALPIDSSGGAKYYSPEVGRGMMIAAARVIREDIRATCRKSPFIS